MLLEIKDLKAQSPASITCDHRFRACPSLLGPNVDPRRTLQAFNLPACIEDLVVKMRGIRKYDILEAISVTSPRRASGKEEKGRSNGNQIRKAGKPFEVSKEGDSFFTCGHG